MKEFIYMNLYIYIYKHPPTCFWWQKIKNPFFESKKKHPSPVGPVGESWWLLRCWSFSGWASFHGKSFLPSCFGAVPLGDPSFVFLLSFQWKWRIVDVVKGRSHVLTWSCFKGNQGWKSWVWQELTTDYLFTGGKQQPIVYDSTYDSMWRGHNIEPRNRESQVLQIPPMFLSDGFCLVFC